MSSLLTPGTYLDMLTTASEQQKTKKKAIGYSTKVNAPKKSTTEKEKKVSKNVALFLAKQEEEKQAEAKRRKIEREKLLQLRSEDRKSFKKAKMMVQRTKSSNKSVLAEARNDRDTAHTMTGREQCDEDDYGYESKDQDSMYKKLMAKFEAAPEDPMAKFSRARQGPAPVGQMSKIKARVKASLKYGDEEAQKPSVRAPSSSSSEPKERKRRKRANAWEPDPPPPPPEQRKTKKELEEIAARKRRMQNQKKAPIPAKSFADLMNLAQKVPKDGSAIPKLPERKRDTSPIPGGSKPKPNNGRPMTKKMREEWEREVRSRMRKQGILPPAHLAKKEEEEKKKKEKEKESQAKGKAKAKREPSPPPVKKKPVITGPEFHPAVMKSMKKSSSSSGGGSSSHRRDEPRPGPSSSKRPRQDDYDDSPPRFKRPREPSPESPIRRGGSAYNRIDSDYSDEYDSEMDDFIDDGGDEVTANNYSHHIRKLMGYNPNKYRHIDDSDDRSMENNSYSGVMKEEARSARIGRMEDEEDMRREEEENRRKRKKSKSRR